MVLPITETNLYWSMRGEIACPRHALRISDERWNSEGWAALPKGSQGFRGLEFQCPHCSPNRTALVHRRVALTPWSEIADSALAGSHTPPDET